MNDSTIPRCRILPLPDHQAAFLIDGAERLRWHYDGKYPRPFFYPLNGPSGHSLTRMGHPGDWGHEHHRSIWFAHHDVAGENFWNDRTEARIEQKRWYAYQDGEDAAAMACLLGWRDGQGREVLEQELIAQVGPKVGEASGGEGETFVRLQASFRPAAETLTLNQSNFGFLAVRVAKNIAAFFGGGKITNSERLVGEPAIFGQPASWMDYSGPVPGGDWEGITYFDHPGNPRYPSRWHVREDGWMGASVCRTAPLTIPRDEPLSLRYLLHAHAGALDAKRAAAIAAVFAHTPASEVVESDRRHTGYVVRPVEGGS